MDDNCALSPAADSEWNAKWLSDHPAPALNANYELWRNLWTQAQMTEGDKRGLRGFCSIGYHEKCSDPQGHECRCHCHPHTSQTGNKAESTEQQTTSTAPITVFDANDVLAVCGHPGRFTTPGGFRTALVNAMIHADPTNLALLGLGFPGLAAAVWVYKNEPGGSDRLAGLVAYGVSSD